MRPPSPWASAAVAVLALLAAHCGSSAATSGADASSPGAPDGAQDGPGQSATDSGDAGLSSHDATSPTDSGPHDAQASSDATAPSDASSFDSPSDAPSSADAPFVPIDGGALRWSRVLGGAGWDEVKGLAVTATGDPVLAGQIENTVDVGCGPLAAQYRDVLVARYAGTDGSCRWSSRYGGYADDGATAMAFGPAGVVYLGGHFRSASIDFGGGALPSLASNVDTPFVAALVDHGTSVGHQWSEALHGRAGTAGLPGLAGGAAPFIAGSFNQAMQFNGTPVTTCCPAFDGMYAASLTGSGASAGAATWAVGARVTDSNTTDTVYAGDVAVTGSTVLVSGSVDGAADFGSTHLVPTGLTDAFLAGYDAGTGALSWIKHWGVAGDRAGGGRLLVEPGGTVLFTGKAPQGADLGQGPLVGFDDHLFFMRVDAKGDVLAVATLFVGYGSVFDVAERPDGSIVVLGAYRGTLPIAGQTLTSLPTGDPFLGVLSHDLGTWLYAEPISTPGEDFNPGRIALSPVDGSMILALNFVTSVDLRAQHFVGPGSWDVLLADLP